MKNLINRVFVLIVVGMCAIAVQAQTGTTVYAKVPFAFSIGDKHMESGQYSIQLLAHNVESWKNESGHPAALVMTISKETMGDIGRPRLVFRRFGESYVLSEVWTNYSASELPTGKYAKKLAALSGQQTIALLEQPAK
jgi:hypothetical protein